MRFSPLSNCFQKALRQQRRDNYFFMLHSLSLDKFMNLFEIQIFVNCQANVRRRL